MSPTTTTSIPEREEARLIATIRGRVLVLAALPASSAEAQRSNAELRSLRAQLEALYRRWPGPRGVLMAQT